MRKALIPMLASLALCGAATTAVVMSSARAEPGPRKPMMVAMVGSPEMQMAANDAAPDAPPPRGLRQQPSPQDIAARMKQMCNDGYARQSAQLAYLEASLQLTAAERPLFERWKDAKLTIAHRHADACAQRPVPQRLAGRGARPGATGGNSQADRQRPSPADRMAREEDRLKERLADLQTERPALEAFYNALSPAQKMEMARGAMRDGRDGPGMMMRQHMFADAMGPRRPMGGPMGRQPGPPDGPGAPPPER